MLRVHHISIFIINVITVFNLNDSADIEVFVRSELPASQARIPLPTHGVFAHIAIILDRVVDVTEGQRGDVHLIVLKDTSTRCHSHQSAGIAVATEAA